MISTLRPIAKMVTSNAKYLEVKGQLDGVYQIAKKITHNLQDLKLKALKSIDYEVVSVSEHQLKIGYENLRERLSEITIDNGILTSISTIFSSIWVTFSGSGLLESPVPLLALTACGGVVVKNSMEAYYIKKYARLSVLSNPVGPALSDGMNDKIQRIIAGNNPMIRLSRHGLEVIGPLGNLEDPSLAREKAILLINSMKHIVVPSCVLGRHADSLIGKITKSWVSSATLPFSFFHIMSTLSRSSENRSLADYIVAGFSVNNIYEYFSLAAICEIRKKISEYLEKGKTPEEILKLLIDGNDLDQGMSLLHLWAKDTSTLGVKIDWMGRLVISKDPYKNISLFKGGIYPMQEFPSENRNQGSGTNDSEKEKLIYALGAFSIAGIAALILTMKKKAEEKS
jgi:hypothetical protein